MPVPDPREFFKECRFMQDCKRRTDLGIPKRGAVRFSVELAAKFCHHVPERFNDLYGLPPLMTGAFSRMSPCSVAFANRIRISPFRAALFKPFAGMFKNQDHRSYRATRPPRHKHQPLCRAVRESQARRPVGSCIQRFQGPGPRQIS